ncbi:MAG: Biotin synthase [Phycisphaerae bacterium]|nr:Biotin synthase [Phycisphaerae bacterium]
MSIQLRHDWTLDEIRAIHELPLMELVHRAQGVHRQAWGEPEVQLCALLSIKTGGCPEDCGYCAQSVHHKTELKAEKLMGPEEILAEARIARDQGATRFCMGAAWRDAPEGSRFEQVLAAIRGVRELGMEACVTLGMLTQEQADRLAEAGLTSYNHNLDTGESYYGRIVSTHTYADRQATLERVRKAGIQICCGGIIGMGEKPEHRWELLRTLAAHRPHPESVPINALVPIAGTPLADQPPTSTVEMVRMIATARILMPRSRVRLAAGRLMMSDEAQLLCFLAGANSIFFGDRLLTTGNPNFDADKSLLAEAGLRPSAPHAWQPGAAVADD